MELTRRQFLKCSAATAGLLLASNPLDLLAASPTVNKGFGILIDTTRCVGCRSCQIACKRKNNLPEEAIRYVPNETYPPALSATTFTLVEFHRVTGPTNQTVIKPVKKQCMHCVEPACASVCPVGALVKTPAGPVTYDPEKCIGCRYCMAACPFNIPKYEWDSATPRIRKCDLCADRVAVGQIPACVEACPTKALLFASRDELIIEAEKRIQTNPDKYVHYIYGRDEVGGTSVLYLADVPFEQLGFRSDLPKEPLPQRTNVVMSAVPMVAIGTGLLLSASAWAAHRRKANGPVAE